MLVALLTDTHFSARKSSKLFQDYFELFYSNVFFPTLEQYGITTVIHMGDAFDSRKSIDFSGLEWTKRVVLDPLSKYKVHMITGNHDCYLRNSNRINSPELLLRDYENIHTYSETVEIKVDNLNVLLIPWINPENKNKTLKLIQKTKCKIAMGHLELQGFRVNRNLVMEDGLSSIFFDKFQKVFSGHYHTRSNNEVVHYIGNPYEIYWNDVNDTRGFVIFDTDTLEHFYIDNPYRMFHNIYYEDTNYQTFNTKEYEDKIVKVIVRKKTDIKQFEKFIDKLYSSNVSDLKIVENFQLQETESFEAFESENTFSILQRYIDEVECDLNKTVITSILEEVYKESLEMV
tara:strand:+ start:119 stop:1153 length:1035 start_codon:yes stop_codon:yes gene_type:complete